MSKFNLSTVQAFLLDQGCESVKARSIATFIDGTLRSGGLNAEVVSQEASADFSSYAAAAGTSDGNAFVLTYTARSLGNGLVERLAAVTGNVANYTVNVTEATAEDAPEFVTPVEVPAVVEEVAVEEVVEVEANEVAETEVTDEALPISVDAVVEETEVTETPAEPEAEVVEVVEPEVVADPEPIVVAPEVTEEPAAAAPKKSKKKSAE